MDVAKVCKALSSELNIDLLRQIEKKGGINTEDLSHDLTVMPINRRLNILKDAKLIERIPLRQRGTHLENCITTEGLDVCRLIKRMEAI